MLAEYQQHTQERAQLSIPPLPLDAVQTSDLCELLKKPAPGTEELFLHLLRDRFPPGVDQADYVKAGVLTAIAKGVITRPLVSAIPAVDLLGTIV
ncbi:MAG: aconitate hydratase B, partial [Aphanizomenon sp.]